MNQTLGVWNAKQYIVKLDNNNNNNNAPVSSNYKS